MKIIFFLDFIWTKVVKTLEIVTERLFCVCLSHFLWPKYIKSPDMAWAARRSVSWFQQDASWIVNLVIITRLIKRLEWVSASLSQALQRFTAFKWESFLKHRRLAIWIQERQLVERIDLESEGSLLVNAHLREVLEDLLKRSLLNTILLDVHVLLLWLDETEQVADSLVLTRHSQLVEVATLLEHLNLSELATQLCNDLEAILLCEAELD